MTARILASPNARRLARELGVSLEDLTGSGPDGRIIGRDVAAARLGHRTPVAILTGTPDRIRLRPGRPSVPPATARSTLRVGRLLKLRDRLNSGGEPVEIGLDALLARAAARTQRLIWNAMTAHTREPVNVAVGLPGDHATGLVTVLRDADTLPVSAVATALAENAAEHRPEDFEHVRVSVFDLGRFGVAEFEPPLRRRGMALGIGAVHEEAVVRKGKVRAALVIRATLVGDPAADDVRVLAAWMRTFTDLIHEPLRILI
jgi:pyruvate dehydrogenase E2 component (dihydrolipoamide acetyltransferase)